MSGYKSYSKPSFVPIFSKYKRTTLLKEISDGKHEIIVWIAKKKEDSIVLRDPSGLKEFKLTGRKTSGLLKQPLETLLWIKSRIKDKELEVLDSKVIHKPYEERKFDYVDLRKISPEEFAKYSPWILRNPKYAASTKLLFLITRYSREFLYGEDFIELLPPMISIVSDPGLRGAKKLRTKYYGVEYELTSSVIMYKQASAAVFEKVFFTARNIREEPPENIKTGRHLSEFTQLDIEWALSDIDDVMRLAEQLIYTVTKLVADKYSEIIYMIGERKEPVVLKPPFPRITYDEALELAKKLGYSIEWGKELSHEAETAVAEYFGTPIWIIGYPVVSRGFYYLPNPEDPKYNLDFNLILPEGYGEVLDGGTREYRYPQVVGRIKMLGEPLEKYAWFIELVEQGGIPPSSGWGLGLERFARYVAGHKHVAYATPYPKLPGITLSP
ncbi:MAG: aspartate--ammonia ligase [Staphylothermus sp.]|nr:aspartate--ammonia ligase [Staphylothermus sp.]